MCYSVVRFSNNQSISLLISASRDSQDGESRLCEMSHYRIHQQVSKKNIQRLTHAQKRARNKKGKKENEEKKSQELLEKKRINWQRYSKNDTTFFLSLRKKDENSSSTAAVLPSIF